MGALSSELGDCRSKLLVTIEGKEMSDPIANIK
jgi:hypothetical protein